MGVRGSTRGPCLFMSKKAIFCLEGAVSCDTDEVSVRLQVYGFVSDWEAVGARDRTCLVDDKRTCC